MQHVHFRLIGCFLIILLLSLAVTPSAATAQPARQTGWAELSVVAPSTQIIVRLDDGRRLERYFAGTTADELVTLDLSAVSSRERREGALARLRAAPHEALSGLYVEEAGRRIPVVQRFERGVIVAVERPLPFALPKVVGWLLNAGGPCPNCDQAQTAAGQKPTPLPSPLPARHAGDPAAGELIYRAPAAGPNPLDTVTWDQLRQLLPVGLRTK